MHKHCKDCIYHHSADHPKDSPLAKYNDWCSRAGKQAKKAIGWCKLNEAKRPIK